MWSVLVGVVCVLEGIFLKVGTYAKSTGSVQVHLPTRARRVSGGLIHTWRDRYRYANDGTGEEQVATRIDATSGTSVGTLESIRRRIVLGSRGEGGI